MYELKISTDGLEVTKYAKNDVELWRLIHIYYNGTQSQMKELFERLKSNVVEEQIVEDKWSGKIKKQKIK